jgi:excisionase family DNA binding protein
VTEHHEVLSIDQLARYLGVPKSTLYGLVREGKIPSHKVGRQWRFRREAIDRWLDGEASPRANEGNRA